MMTAKQPNSQILDTDNVIPIESGSGVSLPPDACLRAREGIISKACAPVRRIDINPDTEVNLGNDQLRRGLEILAAIIAKKYCADIMAKRPSNGARIEDLFLDATQARRQS